MFVRLSKLVGEGRAHNAIDRVYFLWTPLLLCTVIASLLIYWIFGKPIACWVPAEFQDFHHQHAESVCWTTAKVHMVTPAPGHHVHSPAKPIVHGLHLWLPFVLALMAVISILPNWAWSIYIAGSDVKLDNLSSVFRRPRLTDDDRKSTNHENRISRGKFRFLYECLMGVALPRHDVVLVLAYVALKVMNLCAVDAQSGILDALVPPDSTDRLWTTDIFRYLHSVDRSSITYNEVAVRVGNTTIEYSSNTVLPFSESRLFPIMILCDLSVRHIGRNMHKYTVQCSMNVNYYSRVIIAFISTWLSFVRIATIVDLVVWVFRLLITAGEQS